MNKESSDEETVDHQKKNRIHGYINHYCGGHQHDNITHHGSRRRRHDQHGDEYGFK
jgi:hypothetical protein